VPVVYDGVGKDDLRSEPQEPEPARHVHQLRQRLGPRPADRAAGAGGKLAVPHPAKLFDYIATTEELDESAAALFDVIARGAVKIEIGQTFPLADARAAHEALEGRRTIGATLLIP
jgi:NADPH2:quinone reductase